MSQAQPVTSFAFKIDDRESEANAVSNESDSVTTSEDYFLEDPSVTDVTLLVEDKRLHVSKSMLIQASPVFRTMFTSGFKEKDAQQIPFPEKKYESFALFMRCIFPNEYIELDEEKVGKVLPLANEYDVCALKQKCQGWLLNEIKVKLLQSRIPDFNRDVQRDLEFFMKCMYYGAEYDLNALYQEAFNQVVLHKSSRYWLNEHYGLLTEKRKCELLESRVKKIETSIGVDKTFHGQSGLSSFTFGVGSSAHVVKQSTRQITIPPDLFQ